MRIYTVIDGSGWCWETTAREMAKNLPQHDFDVTCDPRVEEAQTCDLIWMRGYPYLFRRIREAGVPFVWSFTSGGDRAGIQFERTQEYISASAGIICQNQEGMELMRKAGMDRLWLIPNGVDTVRFSPAPRFPRRFIVGMAANVNGERWVNKGADVVVAACRAGGFKLRMATKPKPGSDLREPKHNIGLLGHEAMPDFLRGLSVFCQPSTAEGCSNSIMEAMACGLPCIICRESGYHGEVCRDGAAERTGEVLFVPPHDAKAVAESIAWLRDFPQQAARIGENARRFALEHSWGIIARKFNSAFESAVRFVPERKTGIFHLVTAATQDYADCLRAMLPTWMKNSGAATITVASDGPIAGLPAGVDVRAKLAPPANWVAGCMAKAEAVNMLLPEWKDGDRVVFLDADCAVVRNLAPLAEAEEDLTLTRFETDSSRHPRHRGTCAVGAFAVTITPKTRRFLALWLRVQQAYAAAGHGIRPGKIACDQFSMTDIARGRACGVKVRNIDDKVWNSNAEGSDDAWLGAIREHRPAVLHFKGGRWKNRDLVDQALVAAGKYSRDE